MCGDMAPCVPDQDCKLGEWGPWSPCSCTCFGVRERRRVVVTFRAGNGKACIDCKVDAWSDWSVCSATCDGGQTIRSREILSPLTNDCGKPCTDALSETKPCNAARCGVEACIDCQWGMWSEWSECSKCGGQRWRHWQIDLMPNYCGQRCDAGGRCLHGDEQL